MDGTVTIFRLITSLFDPNVNFCEDGCLLRNDAPERLSFQTGSVQFQKDSIGSEVYLGYDLDHAYGPFQPTVAASITDTGDVWAGAGFKWTSVNLMAGPVFLEASFIPGFHFRDDGPDIGGDIQFRSALGAGYAFDNGSTLTLSLDHRSNGGRQSTNPGLETLSIRYAISLD